MALRAPVYAVVADGIRPGMAVRKARALIRLEWRSVYTTPALVDAYRRGDIS